MPDYQKTNTLIVFSESFEGRDYLRNRVNEYGFNAVCFEKEVICFDNFKSLAPKIVIAQTDSRQVVWRFIFSICAMGLDSPLLIVSDNIKAEAFSMNGVEISLHFTTIRSQGDRLSEIIPDIIENQQNTGYKAHIPLFLGEAAAIEEIRSMLPSIANSLDPVLIIGEQGTGKELLVRSIAGISKDESLIIKIDCGELHPQMMINGWLERLIATESDSKPVTIFFDGIHLMSKEIQAEILLIMEEADNWKTSQNATKPRDIRIFAASEVIIEDLVRNGEFRKDLFYRLNVIPIHMPPLRDRKEDITLLMDYFIINAGAASKKCIMIPSHKTRDSLYLYHWPGNVEELKTYMGRISTDGNESCIFANNNIPKVRKNTREYFLKSASVEDLPKPNEIKNFLPDMQDLSLKGICEKFVSRTEKKLMQKALETTNWNRKKAAELLNISYKSMLNKMKAYDIV